MDISTFPDDDFQGMTSDRYVKTSEPTWSYNCVAWVLSRTDGWIDPAGPEYGAEWPIECTSRAIDNFVELFRFFGFTVTTSIEFENNKEKIVLFSNDGCFTHVAKLDHCGRWSSKIGDDLDCLHDLRAVEGRKYGSPDTYMERLIP